MKNERPAALNITEAGFIYFQKPFICKYHPFIIPFIPKYIPFIRYKRNNGFTLIELMITLALAGIIAFVAVPNMRNFVLSSKIKNQTSEIVSAINLARSSAINNKAKAMLCVGSGITCTGSNWSSGWIAWVDTNRDNTVTTNEILREATSTSQNVKISFTAASIQFRPDGTSINTGNIEICDSNQNGMLGRRISLNVTGRASVSKVTCSLVSSECQCS